MNSSSISLGAVFKVDWSPEPVRVIAFDNDVVMYDTWWPHKKTWAMSKLLGRFAYYRTHRKIFESRSNYLRGEPLTDQELAVHRPDLPFEFAQSQNVSWYEKWSAGTPSSGAKILLAAEVFLVPFGPRSSSKPSVLVTASNGVSFSEAELLLLAKAIQEPYIGKVQITSGIGIYRSGLQKCIPSYYLWGAKSRLDA